MAKQSHAGTGKAEHAEHMDQCVEDCQECAATCQETIAYCLSKGGKHAEASHIALMMDCASICEAAAASMSRDSIAHRLFCGACAEICKLCEEDCRSMGDDATMIACAEMCRQCAESCEAMAA